MRPMYLFIRGGCKSHERVRVSLSLIYLSFNFSELARENAALKEELEVVKGKMEDANGSSLFVYF